MKITMTTPMEGPGVSRLRGDEIEVDDAEGVRLCDATFATEGWASDAIVPAAAPKPAAKKPAAKS